MTIFLEHLQEVSLHAFMLFGYTSEEIYNFFKLYAKKIKYIDVKNILKLIYGLIFKKKIIINGLNSGEIIENLINEKCSKKNIENINQIKTLLAIPAVDIYSGNIYYFISQNKRNKISNKNIYINDINIGKAVRASCSYPVVFSPCEFNNKILVDGGIRENIPWREIKNLGADKVLSVAFEKNIKEKTCDNIVDIVGNSISILNDELSNYEITGTDYLINIQAKKIGLLDMDKIDYLYELGYNETKKQIKKLKI